MKFYFDTGDIPAGMYYLRTLTDSSFVHDPEFSDPFSGLLRKQAAR